MFDSHSDLSRKLAFNFIVTAISLEAIAGIVGALTDNILFAIVTSFGASLLLVYILFEDIDSLIDKKIDRRLNEETPLNENAKAEELDQTLLDD